MTSTSIVGFVLVGLSAVMLASHWQRWRERRPGTGSNTYVGKFERNQLLRRSFASSLLGVIGIALTVHHEIPPRPLTMSIYLFGLLFLTAWILCLGLIDLVATRQFRQSEQIDQVADEFRKAGPGAVEK